MKRAGVYIFINGINGRVYVGSSFDIGRRCKEHIQKRRGSKILIRAMDKHGVQNFTFLTLEEVNPNSYSTKKLLSDKLFEIEQKYLDQYYAQEFIDSKGKDRRFVQYTYNLNPIAKGPRGREITKEECMRRKKWWDNHPEEKKRRSEIAKIQALGNKSRTGIKNSNAMKFKRSITEFKNGRRKLIISEKEGSDSLLHFGFSDCAKTLKCSEMNVRKSFFNNTKCKGRKLRLLDMYEEVQEHTFEIEDYNLVYLKELEYEIECLN